ncbi:PREDICTED: uncharacterized protein LOC104780867 isoform X2 [Camelina sativa]|uniref:Uncharacterized protein LOC104780867 isoform X1 n=1 Tax=Camelina sativa TaxID=90675 RepID=A0ABM0YNQ4_CAMSA|nr:PREDICTED: uncharacterized protein LOC104780867 isoform X1 [Camelina sativa]XP_010503708.1 PREDICTED: uncharacterized protein LOC104780867 isoform X2 [Camelina sativa]
MFSDRRKRDMANHGDGNKYASVNLNKSYGYQSHHQYNQSGGYGANRGRGGGGGGYGGGGVGGGGGGGSMVVLSRPRSSQNAGPKLSVPPPLNLPSLRKEHERVDSSGSSFHSGGGITGTGTRPASSGIGWSKPAATATDGDTANHTAEGVTRGSNGLNISLASRVGAAEPMERAFHHVEKVATLRGEDFPSLKASLPSASVSGQKQKEGVNQKQKQGTVEEFSKEPRGVSGSGSSLVDMRPQNQSGRSRLGNELSESPSFSDGLHSSEQMRKKDYFPGPLPLVRLAPRSDWADDERDTSHGLRDRDRDHGYSKNEPFWDRGFDLPRTHVLPQKHATPNSFDKPGQRENEPMKSSMTQVRPVSGGGREANAWRVSAPLQNEGAHNNKNIYGARPSSRGREAAKKSNYVSSSSRENVWNNTGAREAPYQHGGRQPWNNNMDSYSNRGTFNRDGYGMEHQNRGNRPFFKSDKPHVEDPFIKDFGDSGYDVHDPFPVLGVAKKKKEALKQTEFHDPVRESFEAELERVQKVQEEERRRIIEEQERVMELARTEEEEKLRQAREQDEQQRRLEEEAREAAFRNEQERVEAARRAEELRKSKEEEKHRLLMEEERRKQAAKQKLLELEEKISRRQAEAAKGCSSSSTVSEDKFLDIVKEKESADVVDWEDSERMVDRITTSSTSDLPVPIRSFENNAASQFSRDGSFGFPDRQKPTWRKEDIESGSNSRFVPQNMENVPHSPQEEFFGTTGYLSAPSYFKPGFPEHSIDQSWRIPGDGRTHARMESESRESFGEQYGEPGWGQNHGRARHGPYPTYPEKLYQNPEGDDYYPFGRPRYSVRQPRVLPPPQESRQKPSFRSGEGEHPGPSTSVGGINYNHTGRTNSTVLASYIGELQDHHVLPGSGIDEHHQLDSKLTGRCDSQSSLSVTSPPDSPVHLSHDDLDESADASVLATSRKGEDTGLLEKRGAPNIPSDTGKDSLMIATGSVSCWDNEEWTLDSNERLQEQEEYDEDEDGYQEDDKIHGVDENIDLAEELEEMHLEDKDSNLVLGFNEGVEVEIPSDDFEKCQQNSEATFPLTQQSVDSVDNDRPSIEKSRGEQAAQPVEVSDPLSMHNVSRNFQGAETMMQNLSIHQNNGRQSFEVANKVGSTSNSTVSTHPVIPPHSTSLHPSSLQTAIPPVSTTSAQMEEPVKFQFGLFSGPSLIPSPFPAIQIGSIQMPLPLHPQFGSSLTHMQQPQSPIIQFGQLRYTSPISQGVLPPPHHSVIQGNGLSTYALNQNPGPSATVQPGQGNSGNLIARNAATSVSNPQLSVLRRPTNVSDGGTLKNANKSLVGASIEAAVLPQKQPELSGKSQLPSRKMSHGKSNFVERQSGYQVQSDTTAVRNSGMRSSGTAEVSRVDSSGNRRYRRQRVEFRVRESNWPSSEDNRNGNGRAHNSTKNGSRKYVVSNKFQKQALDSSVSGLNAMQKTISGGSYENRLGKDAVVKNPLSPNSGQANLKRNMISEKEIDAPLQSGIVRVFEQHGIEGPSDDDDFIEVRSKRQMLNDRREQREKEIKEKSQASKASRKPRSTFQTSTTAARSNRSPPASRVANNKQFNPVSNRQLLAPIGTPSPKTDSHADEKSGSNKSTQASSAHQVIPKNDQNPASGLVFSNKKVLDNSHTSVGTWGNQLTYQPVMALTQSQLDEAMKPVSLLSCVSVENGANRISEPSPTPVSVVPKNSTFSSSTIPINSLLAEGKIQFGAVTSSTVIPPCGGRTENDSSLYFEKDNKHCNPSSTGMEICEAEAEAAASAIAVAAITNDETGGNASSTGPVLPVETKIYGGTELDDGSASGTVGGEPSLSKAEESLIVSLPADLSVDTPISLWPPVPSPHNSNQMITHFPPGPPHYPFFDVNPMLRGPIYAFGPHHDAGANHQSQSQKGPGTVSGPPTTWQPQGHSGVDSFYAPSGFTGPFLTPPGTIPGVQGPPHMFVYNHFAPVGQFGGLSFMGTTYIPSGKQPDWKHNPIVSSSPVGGDGDVNNPNVASMQCNIVPASLQHLPMPVFDPSFQSSSQEMPVRARWPYMPFSGPPTMQMQKQQEAADGSNLPSPQFNNMLPPPPNRYPNMQASTAADALVESSNAYSSSSTSCAPPPKATTTLSNPNRNNTQNPTGPGFKPPAQQQQQQQQSSQEKNTPSQHGGGSSHHHQQHQHNRRSGFHGRNQPMARERGFPNNPKVKQIYVAKQTGNSNASASSTTNTSPSI